MKLHASAKQLTGKIFGRLTVLEPLPTRRHQHVVWRCQCECGEIVEATSSILASGDKKSCGYLQQKPIQQQPPCTARICLTKPSVVTAIIMHAEISGTTPTKWAENALEDWILKHRSGRYVGDPDRHTERNDDNTTIYHD